MRRGESYGWIIVILLALLMGFCSIVLSSSPDQGVLTDNKPTNTQVPLTQSLKDDICREMDIWTDYCYDTGIKLDACVNQFIEKALRIYEITPDQLRSVIEYCQSMTAQSDMSNEELKQRWDATTGR